MKRNQHAEEKGWVFSFDFKEKTEEECLTEREEESSRSQA